MEVVTRVTEEWVRGLVSDRCEGGLCVAWVEKWVVMKASAPQPP